MTSFSSLHRAKLQKIDRILHMIIVSKSIKEKEHEKENGSTFLFYFTYRLCVDNLLFI